VTTQIPLPASPVRDCHDPTGRSATADPGAGRRLNVFEKPARLAIARHIGLARGVPAGAEQVVVTNGTQQAVDLVARVLLA
jgi:DNA-binding transcriptional MocR family regulator